MRFTMMVAVVVGTLWNTGCNCEKEKPEPYCRHEAAGGPECPSGRVCVYPQGKNWQNPEHIGQCEKAPPDLTCKYTLLCGVMYDQCGLSPARCDEQTGKFCHCEGSIHQDSPGPDANGQPTGPDANEQPTGPHPTEEPTGG